MAKGFPVTEAFIVATLAPAVAVALLTREWIAIIPALYFTAAHTAILGVPFFLLIRKRGWFNVVRASAGGLVIGLLPVATITCPLWLQSSPTTWEWRGYLSTVIAFGAFGGFGGLVFSVYLSARESMILKSTQ
jgi:hypothetical protein